MIRHVLPLSLFVALASVPFAQAPAQTQQSGKPATQASGLLVGRVVSQAFEAGLVVAPATMPNEILQSVILSWHGYPNAHYRVQRTGQPHGPWATIHDVTSTRDSLAGLPPSSSFYVRVLALVDGAKRGYLLADSTSVVTAQTGAPAGFGLPQAPNVRMTSCTAGPGNHVTLAWSPVRGFTRYVVTPYMIPPLPSGPVQPGNLNLLAINPQTPKVVTDTVLGYSMPGTGTMVLRVQARVDIGDWPMPGQTFTYLTQSDVTTSNWRGIRLDAGGAHCV